MERKYNIDGDFLRYVKSIIKECHTLQADVDIFLIDKLINVLENTSSKEIEFDSMERRLSADLYDLAFYKPYYPFVRRFCNSGFIDSRIYCPEYNNIYLSDGDAVSLVIDFYKDNRIVSNNVLDDLYDDISDHLKFVNEGIDTDGETTFIRSTGDFFVLVPDKKDIRKVAILTHETTHVLDSFDNPNFSHNFLISEFNALFKEMIASDYFAKILNLGNDNFKRRYYLHSLIKKYADDIYYRMQILNLYGKKGLDGNSGCVYDVFDKRYVEYLMQDSLADNYIYQIAYLIAIELYTLYKVDRDKALWISKYIVNNCDNDNILRLLKDNGMELNQHSIEYENDLRLKLHI